MAIGSIVPVEIYPDIRTLDKNPGTVLERNIAFDSRRQRLALQEKYGAGSLFVDEFIDVS